MVDHAHDTEILEPEPVRQGGLQKNMVSSWVLNRDCS
jgi:hypothetical protein